MEPITIALAIFFIAIIIVLFGVKVVPQSQVYVVERFGKYTVTLSAGLSFIVPFLDKVAHKVSILERQLPEFRISVITRDNVEVELETTTFYRVTDASRSVYRIADVNAAVYTAASSIVRSVSGKLELDELQSSRQLINNEIEQTLKDAAAVWGLDITRTEITDVVIDEETKSAQRQQLNAERERRATIARAEGEKRSIELSADARLYEAQKEADAIRLKADADAYAVKVQAEADASQIRLITAGIKEDGQSAVNFELMKRQIGAVSQLASGDSTKTIVLPTNITTALGGLESLLDLAQNRNKEG